MTVAAWYAPPLRATKWFVVSKATITANPVQPVSGPCDSPTIPLIGAAEGVTSNSAVNVPV